MCLKMSEVGGNSWLMYADEIYPNFSKSAEKDVF